jgi:pyruvate/2-oxoglutarate dehydrogenase complex dihydrolipoamide dehydrogenase (E3) component
MTDTDRDLVVIGGGPGGYAAAFLAADLCELSVSPHELGVV